MKRYKDGPTMNVVEAAKALGMSPNFLMERLREGQLSEIGFAIKAADESYRYYIYKTKVRKLVGEEGDDGEKTV